MKSRRHAASATLALSVLLHVGLLWYTGSQVRPDPYTNSPPPTTAVEILLQAAAPLPALVPDSAPEVTEPEPAPQIPAEPPSPEPQTVHAPRDDGQQSEPPQTEMTAVEDTSIEDVLDPPPLAESSPMPEEPLASPETDSVRSPDPQPVQPDRISVADANDDATPDDDESYPGAHTLSGEIPMPEDSALPISDSAALEAMSTAFDGRLVPLDDQTLADASLVSNAGGSSRNARIADEGFLVNLYLRRMTEQVYAAWRDWTAWQKRHKHRRALTGTISFQVSLSGTLESARISKSSGNAEFDRSALAAIESVRRFAVPEDPAVTARYYRKLRFHFSTESREIGAILKASASAG